MKGYIPEGSYYLLREMFENEVLGTTLINWTGETNVAIIEHPDSDSLDPHNYFNKYTSIEMQHNSSATHRTRLPDVNDLTQVLTGLIRVDSGNANASEFRVRARDTAGNVILGMGTTKTGGNVYPQFNGGTGGGWVRGNDAITEDIWHELRVFIHNDNSPTPNRIEFQFDGHTVWYDGGLNRYTRDKTQDEEVKKVNAKISYIDIVSSNTTDGDLGYWSAFVIKEWADQANECPEGLPYLQSLVEANDKATYWKLRNIKEQLSTIESVNENPVCNYSLAPLDINSFMENFTLDDDDGEWTHISFDRRFRVFKQQSTYIMHGWQAESLLGNPDRLVDSLVDFTALGVAIGDKLWIYKKGEAIDNPFEVTSIISATTLEVTPDISDGVSDVDYISYHICRSLPQIEDSALGDYIFKGQLKGRDYQWNDSTSLDITALGDLYIAIQRHLGCHGTRYYRKDLDDALTGRFRYDSVPGSSEADQIVSGLSIVASQILEGLDIGNYAGMLGYRLIDINGPDDRVFFYQAFQRNIQDTTTDTQEAPITKQWGSEQNLYEAIVSLCDTLFLQMDCYTDDEFRDERKLFFRDRKLIEDTPLYDFWVGELYPANFDITETERPLKSVSFNKSTREFIDRVMMLGASDPDISIIMGDDQPPNQEFTNQTREVIRENTNILDLNLVRQNAIAMLAALNRKPLEGDLMTTAMSRQETWFDGIYLDDNDVESYYERQSLNAGGYFMGDSDWFTNLTAGGENEKDRTSQGHLHRRPFSPVGEVGRLNLTATKTENFIINSKTFTSSPGAGMVVAIEPDQNPFENAKFQTGIKREIEWTKQTLGAVDTAVQPCEAQPIGKLFEELERYIAVGMAPRFLQAHVALGAGISQLQFNRFNYQDVINSLSAYGYMVFSSDTGLWGSWQSVGVVGFGGAPPTGLNLITDIDDFSPLIVLNNDPGANYGNVAFVNYINVNMNGLGYAFPLNLWFMVVLVSRHVIDTSPPVIHYIPRTITPATPVSTGNVNQTETAAAPFWNGQDEFEQIIRLIDGPFLVN